MIKTKHSNSFPLTGKVAAQRSEGVTRSHATAHTPSHALQSPPQSLRDSSPVKGEQLKGIARNLRNNATEHERWLWTELRGLKLYGARFRRQVLIEKYIVDFCCYRSRIIVELDGIQHSESQHASKDKIRDAWLKSQGFIVLRYWNSELHEDFNAVLDAIYQTVIQRINQGHKP